MRENRSHTNYGLWAGMTADVASDDTVLDAMFNTGIVGFKGFLSESGIDDFKRLDRQALSRAMAYCGQKGAVLALRAEWEDTIKQFAHPIRQTDRKDVSAFLDSRPVDAELKAAELAMEEAAKYGTKVHIVHVSHPKVVELIQSAKKTGVDVSLETCPHYLIFNEEDFIQQGPLLKCAPPLRDSDCVNGLWEKVKNKQIDCISSDHSPCPLSMKQAGNENIWEAWGGIQGVQFGTTAFLSQAMSRGLSLEEVLPMLTANVASRFPSLEKQGEIKIGNQANLTIYHSDSKTVFKKEDILFRHPYSPYVGQEVQGNVEATIVNGNLVFDREKGMLSDPFGKDICAM
ncbi:allantoinase [Salipaludibacillus neizhouensis]|uniref:Allantoinase n=2 Tax=Salipaludibacillus neizhouensis TaxID=885475 RepID=A0A3A9K7R9_9BACI|nr:allantoinase [Salipaludibacillus neizhouensis]